MCKFMPTINISIILFCSQLLERNLKKKSLQYFGAGLECIVIISIGDRVY